MSSILLVDDHAVLRAGLRLLLDAQPDLHVAGEAEDSRAAVAQAAALQPDLILLDLSLTNCSGLAAIPSLRTAAPKHAFSYSPCMTTKVMYGRHWRLVRMATF